MPPLDSAQSTVSRLLLTAIDIQGEQLDVLERILLLAGERSSSLPDPHHQIEGEAVNRSLATLFDLERRYSALQPALAPEVRTAVGPNYSGQSPPSFVDQLLSELEEFSTLQQDALKSLQQSVKEEKARGNTVGINATMASQLFDVLSTKHELLVNIRDWVASHQKKLQEGQPYPNFQEGQGDEVTQNLYVSNGHTFVQSQPRSAGLLSTNNLAIGKSILGSLRNDDPKGSDAKEGKGHKFGAAVATAALGAVAAAVMPNVSNPFQMSRNAAGSEERANETIGSNSVAARLFQKREDSVASSEASWKNEFHQAVLRSMMQSESPQQAVAAIFSDLKKGGGLRRKSRDRASPSPIPSDDGRSPLPRVGGGEVMHSSRSSSVDSAHPLERSAQSLESVDSASTALLADTRSKRQQEILSMRKEIEEVQVVAAEILAQANQVISDSDDAVMHLSHENNQLRDDIQKLHARLAARESDVDRTSKEIDSYNKRQVEAIQALKSEKALMAQRIEELEQECERRDDERGTMARKVDILSHKCERQEQQLQHLLQREDELSRELEGQSAAHAQELEAIRKESDAGKRQIAALQKRVRSLEEEAQQWEGRYSDLEKVSNEVKEKFNKKHLELRDVKILFTQLEGKYQASQQELCEVKRLLSSKDDELHRIANIHRLQQQYGKAHNMRDAVGDEETSRPKPSSPLHGKHQHGKPSPVRHPASKRVNLLRTTDEVEIEEGERAQQRTVPRVDPNAMRMGSTPRQSISPPAGRLMRLSFDSPRRSSTGGGGGLPLQPQSDTAEVIGASKPTSGPLFIVDSKPAGKDLAPPQSSSHEHVHRVLADAAELLRVIHCAPRSGGKKQSDGPTPSTASTAASQKSDSVGRDHGDVNAQSLTARNGSEDSATEGAPFTREAATAASKQQNGDSTEQMLLKELEDKEQNLLREAAGLASQERSVLEKRSIVSSTLLAQRNQLLMKNAPDEDIERLNTQISMVMERINQATSQIQTNKKTVEGSLDLIRRQKRALTSMK